MKDELEKFIVDNRAEFDTESPSNNLWSKIEGDLTPQVKDQKPQYYRMWKVAAMIFLAATVTLAVLLVNSDKQQIAMSDSDGYNTELLEVETYYIKMIEKKRVEIDGYLIKTPIDESSFLNDLEVLDGLYSDLKQDLKDNQNNDKLINAMIQNLQLRVEILNKQLSILEQIKNYQEDEKVTI